MTPRQFHDADFDGIVLKIDSGFMACNPELMDAIKALQDSLKNCKYSLMMPSYTRNLYEIEHFKEKREILALEKQATERYREQEKNRINSLLNGEIFEIEYLKVSVISNSDTDSFDIEHTHFSGKTLFSKKAISSTFKNAFSNHIKQMESWEQFRSFLYDNGFNISRLDYAWEYIDWKASYPNCDSYGNMNIRISVPYMKIYKRGKRSNSSIFYNQCMLQYSQDRGLYISLSNVLGLITKEDKTGRYSSLEGFENVGLKFVKARNTDEK